MHKNFESKNPEQLQQLHDVFSRSIAMKELIAQNVGAFGGVVTNCAFEEYSMDAVMQKYFCETKDPIVVANLLAKEHQKEPVDNSIAGLQNIFMDEEVTQRMQQLRNTPSRIPQEQLKTMHKVKDNGHIMDAEYYIDRDTVSLDDERVLRIYEDDKAQLDMNKENTLTNTDPTLGQIQ